MIAYRHRNGTCAHAGAHAAPKRRTQKRTQVLVNKRLGRVAELADARDLNSQFVSPDGDANHCKHYARRRLRKNKPLQTLICLDIPGKFLHTQRTRLTSGKTWRRFRVDTWMIPGTGCSKSQTHGRHTPLFHHSHRAARAPFSRR